ncbi:MAG: alpha-mannosidase, partial [Clostridia bacterium]|nr:alpha-mannosidase [Clostridia bacterium]
DIKPYYEEKEFDFEFINAEIVEQGSVRAVYKVDKKFRNSIVSEYYNIYNELERIDVDYKTDWKEKYVVLKADYPVDVNAVKATFDIQFGNIERSTTENTTWDFAQFEVSMHKWIDLSDNSFGLSVINDCKYGCTVKDGHLKPTLLRCQTRPNSVQDREYHEFTFSVYPHENHVSASDVVKEAFNVNYPAYAVFAKANNGTLPSEYSFVSADKDNIVIETVKAAEDGNGIIVRAYETWNSKTKAKLTFCNDIKNVVECNLIEDGAERVSYSKNTVEAEFKPFEIKTFRINF